MAFRFVLIGVLSLVTTLTFALGPNDDPAKFEAYRNRLAARRYNALPMRQARALAHQAALRANYNPYAIVARAIPQVPYVQYSSGPSVIYAGRRGCSSSINRLTRAVERLSEY